MADPEPVDEAGAKPSASDFPASTTRLEPAVIDGTAQDVTPPEPEASPARDAPDAELENAVPESEPSETAPKAADAAPQPPRRGGGLLPAALGIVLGGAAGFGGAYLMHRQDNPDAAIAALGTRLAALDQAQSKLAQEQSATSGLLPAQSEIVRRLAAIETESRANAAAVKALRGTVRALTTQKGHVAPAATAAGLAPLDHRIGALHDKLAGLAAEIDDLTGKLAAQKNAVAAAQSFATHAAAAHAADAAVAIIAGSLLRKVEAGVPFVEELTALQNRGVGADEVAKLQNAAATGVATPGRLAAEFHAETNAIFASAPAPKAHGFFSRLLIHAEGLVRIRKVGATAGDGLAAQVARIEDALGTGAIGAAYQAWTRLPAAAKAQSRAFGRAAKTRLDAIAAARALEDGALAHLGKAKS